MLFFSRSKILMILGAVLLGLLLAIPNALTEDTRSKMPASFQRTINLGLDLQGGAHMLLEVDLSSILSQALINERTAINDAFRRADDRPRTEFVRADGDDSILVRLRSKEDADKALPLIQALSQPVDPTQISSAKTTKVDRESDRNIRVTITEAQIDFIRKQTIDKSIGVLGRRIDPNGNLELTLAPEGDERILLQVPGEVNTTEIKKKINESANLSFHLVNEKDSTNEQAMTVAMQTGRVGAGDKYFPFSPTQGGGGLIVVERTRITGDCLKNSSGGPHPENNGAVVNFEFNVACAREFGQMTARNINKRFAVILDGNIITAPNIRSAITGGRGYIEGGFTMASARDLSLLLNAGALPAKLTIVEERTVDPSLGADSIRAGFARRPITGKPRLTR